MSYAKRASDGGWVVSSYPISGSAMRQIEGKIRQDSRPVEQKIDDNVQQTSSRWGWLDRLFKW